MVHHAAGAGDVFNDPLPELGVANSAIRRRMPAVTCALSGSLSQDRHREGGSARPAAAVERLDQEAGEGLGLAGALEIVLNAGVLAVHAPVAGSWQ